MENGFTFKKFKPRLKIQFFLTLMKVTTVSSSVFATKLTLLLGFPFKCSAQKNRNKSKK